MIDLPIAALCPAKLHVFISYSRMDGASIASQLYTDLNANGLTTWHDGLVKPGFSFVKEIETAINNSYAMLALLTPQIHESSWTECERLSALTISRITIIPVVTVGFEKKFTPFELRNLNPFYLTEDYNSSLQDLLGLLKLLRGANSENGG